LKIPKELSEGQTKHWLKEKGQATPKTITYKPLQRKLWVKHTLSQALLP